MNNEQWDAIVIGGSAAGLSAAQALGRSLRRTLVIDSGRPRNRFASHMHNVLGHDGLTPSELAAIGKTEAERYGVVFRPGLVTAVRDLGATVEVELEIGERASSRGLVLATGMSDQLPDIDGLAEHWGTGVLHCPYCHGWEVRGRRIGVLATSPMSMHLIKMLRQWSDQIVAFTGGIAPLDAGMIERLEAREIELVPEPAVRILGDNNGVTAVRTETGQEVSVDVLFATSTPRPHDEMLENLALERNEGPMGEALSVDATWRTSHPRIWAAGNVVTPTAAIPHAMAAGATAGAALNLALVEEDFDQAIAKRKG